MRRIAASLLCAVGFGLQPAAGADLAPWDGGAKPTFALDTLDDGRVALEDVPGPVLVHFFATWCAPCVDELAALDRLAARRPLTILAVDVGEVDARVRSFFAKRPARFPVLLDRDREVTRAWQVMALPSSYVLGADGTLRLFAEGEVDWDAPEAADLDQIIGAPRRRETRGEESDEAT